MSNTAPQSHQCSFLCMVAPHLEQYFIPPTKLVQNPGSFSRLPISSVRIRAWYPGFKKVDARGLGMWEETTRSVKYLYKPVGAGTKCTRHDCVSVLYECR